MVVPKFDLHLREARHVQGRRLKDLARALDCSIDCLSLLERKQRALKIPLFLRWARELDANPHDLITVYGYPPPQHCPCTLHMKES